MVTKGIVATACKLDMQLSWSHWKDTLSSQCLYFPAVGGSVFKIDVRVREF